MPMGPQATGGEGGGGKKEGLPTQAWPAPRELLPGCPEPPGEQGVPSRAGARRGPSQAGCF